MSINKNINNKKDNGKYNLYKYSDQAKIHHSWLNKCINDNLPRAIIKYYSLLVQGFTYINPKNSDYSTTSFDTTIKEISKVINYSERSIKSYNKILFEIGWLYKDYRIKTKKGIKYHYEIESPDPPFILLPIKVIQELKPNEVYKLCLWLMQSGHFENGIWSNFKPKTLSDRKFAMTYNMTPKTVCNIIKILEILSKKYPNYFQFDIKPKCRTFPQFSNKINNSQLIDNKENNNKRYRAIQLSESAELYHSESAELYHSNPISKVEPEKNATTPPSIKNPSIKNPSIKESYNEIDAKASTPKNKKTFNLFFNDLKKLSIAHENLLQEIVNKDIDLNNSPYKTETINLLGIYFLQYKITGNDCNRVIHLLSRFFDYAQVENIKEKFVELTESQNTQDILNYLKYLQDLIGTAKEQPAEPRPENIIDFEKVKNEKLEKFKRYLELSAKN